MGNTTGNKEQQTWLEQEEQQLKQNTNYDKQPSLKLEENKITEIEVDFSKPFEKYNSIDSKGAPITKAIIPCRHNGETKNFWLNCRNPLYGDIIKIGKTGKTKFKILQSGNQANTKYILVNDGGN